MIDYTDIIVDIPQPNEVGAMTPQFIACLESLLQFFLDALLSDLPNYINQSTEDEFSIPKYVEEIAQYAMGEFVIHIDSLWPNDYPVDMQTIVESLDDYSPSEQAILLEYYENNNLYEQLLEIWLPMVNDVVGAITHSPIMEYLLEHENTVFEGTIYLRNRSVIMRFYHE